MASHGASVGRAAKAGEGKVGDGVNARTPVGYDSTGFLFLVSAFPLRGYGAGTIFSGPRFWRVATCYVTRPL